LRKQFSIAEDNYSFKRTLIERLSELQKVYEDVMCHVKNLKKSYIYFSSFVSKVQGTDINLIVLQYLLSNLFLFR
jgi:DNA-binding transcriptional regulator WhiA